MWRHRPERKTDFARTPERICYEFATYERIRNIIKILHDRCYVLKDNDTMNRIFYEDLTALRNAIDEAQFGLIDELESVVNVDEDGVSV